MIVPRRRLFQPVATAQSGETDVSPRLAVLAPSPIR
jgi:hypothetical protein